MNASNYGVPDAHVSVHYVKGPAQGTPVEALHDRDIRELYDDEASAALAVLQEGREMGVTRFVFVIPSVAQVGAARYAATCAAAEAVRVLALSAARQWRDEGVTVNCIAASFPYAPEDLAPLVEFLASEAGACVSGETICVGGPEFGL
jgi:NAD(P)-dependent dehydrogenase (short-subunit alcohol dehydrogenase family)